MVASRHLFGLLLAPILIACLAEKAAVPQHEVALPEEPAAAEKAAAPAIQSKEEALQVFKADLKAIIDDQHLQPVIAIFALALGAIALWDGKTTFKLIVSICVGAVVFIVVLSQLRPTWTGAVAKFAKYFASLQVGSFVGYSSYRGWDGMQLMLGLFLGLYLYHSIQALAKSFQTIAVYSESAVWIIAVSTLMVAFGTWALHAKWGAGRVLGILCPLFGASLIVATCGYLSMLCLTMPKAQKQLHVTVSPEDVPSIFDFWYMIVYPLHSQAVGFFSYQNKFINVNNHKVAIDRVIGIFFWVLLALPSMCLQLKADKRRRVEEKNAHTSRLMAKNNGADGLKENLLKSPRGDDKA